jgi:predicted house-cleaning noncanonical NTP pyrophosphatase (MazG superfamily)
MRQFSFNKLVRDKVVPHMLSSGTQPQVRTLSGPEFIKALKHKLVEESRELVADTLEKSAGELADVQEIVDTLCEALGISKEQLEELQRGKREKAGGFSQRLYIDTVQIADDDPWVEHYLSSPDKYPEIK